MQQYATPRRGPRIALRLMQLGAIAVVLVALPYKSFDLDRYFVPKELVLHLTACGAAALLVLGHEKIAIRRSDLLLLAFLFLGLVSALLASNGWLSQRALAISVSGALAYWAGRALRAAGYHRALLVGIAAAATLGAVTSLLQAYGVESEYFSANRSPGGTFGNRNFMAHVAAIATPALLLCTIVARNRFWFATGTAAVAIVGAAQVLSRSRAAWIALAASLVLMVLAVLRSRQLWPQQRLGRRTAIIAIAAITGVIVAPKLPNTLEWKSRSPYLDSVRGVVDYRKGSGKGRLTQYANSMGLVAQDPLFGVGPGNWAVMYPSVAPRRDPSMDGDGMTSNPWPSSDWVAILAERGIPATLALAAFFVALLFNAFRQVRSAPTPDELLTGAALASTLIGTLLVGAFDAVLLLGAPALIAWTLLGVLARPYSRSTNGATRDPATTPGNVRRWLAPAIVVIGLVAAGRSAFQMAAMSLAAGGKGGGTLERAATFDPGSYKIHMRVAQAGLKRGDCTRARRHARAAKVLFPFAPDPQQMIDACGGQ